MMVQACSKAGDHRSPLQEKQPIPVILRNEMTKDPALVYLLGTRRSVIVV